MMTQNEIFVVFEDNDPAANGGQNRSTKGTCLPNTTNISIKPHALSFHVLDECVVSAQGRFAEKGITISKKYGEGIDLIDADPNQIREIFLNILNNACQSFSGPSGTVEVETSV